MALEWVKIKNEYISTNASMRKLAEKYNISHDAIKRRAAAEKLTEERARTAPIIHRETVRKVIEKTSSREADRIVNLLAISDKLSERLAQAVGELDKTLVKQKKSMRTVVYGDGAAQGRPTKVVTVEQEVLNVTETTIDRLGVQRLSAALKNLRDVAQTGKMEEDALSKAQQRSEAVIIVDDL